MDVVAEEDVFHFADDVRSGVYPSDAESYALPAEAAEELHVEKEPKS